MALKSSMKILLVSEVAGKRQTNRGMLAKIGFKNVAEVGDGEKALEVLKESVDSDDAVKLLIVDWDLPKISGIELVKSLRSDGKLGKTPVLMILAEANQQFVVESAQAKVNGVIVAPFSTNGLMEKIGKIFGQK